MNFIKVICARKFSGNLVKNVRFLSSTPQLKETDSAKKTPLLHFHEEHGGKIVNFAGYLLPVQYADQGIAASHVHTRKHVSVFDVSHMLQTEISGKDAINCFEAICTADLKSMPIGSGTLSVFTNQKGGILDDLIVSKTGPTSLYVVSNAARKEHDMGFMMESVDFFRCMHQSQIDIKFYDPMELALLAVQGPEACKVVQGLTKLDVSKLYFMNTVETEVAGIEGCRVTRCGYTGEDGFEISVPGDRASYLADVLINSNKADVKLAGLGARDSLRLEAGLCLYGNDIDVTTTPVEAGLTWLIAKRRREEKNFPGAEVILKQLSDGCERRRVGIRLESGPPARQGTKIFSEGVEIGEVTSGCPSPSLGGNVAIGYVKDQFKKRGTPVDLKIRDKLFKAVVAKMPFIPSNYYQKPK